MIINKVLKYTIITSLCFGSLIIMGARDSKAVLQSNGNDGATYNVENWMKNVRQMEQVGGAMGLSENINANLTTNGESNNIDVHMQKNTEYGALAILSASSYGNPNKVENGQTTTGNVTGVVMKFNSEWTATAVIGGLTEFSSRYSNSYPRTYVTIKGDAMKETEGWHGGNNLWFVQAPSGIVRGKGQSIFSYYLSNR